MAAAHQGNDLGYGKNAKDWIIRSQVLRGRKAYGCSSTTKWRSVSINVFKQTWKLKIESGPPEMEPGDERPNQPGALGDLLKHRGRSNRTTGITGLWQPSVHSDVAF